MQIHLPVDSVTVMSYLREFCLFCDLAAGKVELFELAGGWVHGTGVACKQTASEITRLVVNVTACVAQIWQPISASEWRNFIAINVKFHRTPGKHLTKPLIIMD